MHVFILFTFLRSVSVSFELSVYLINAVFSSILWFRWIRSHVQQAHLESISDTCSTGTHTHGSIDRHLDVPKETKNSWRAFFFVIIAPWSNSSLIICWWSRCGVQVVGSHFPKQHNKLRSRCFRGCGVLLVPASTIVHFFSSFFFFFRYPAYWRWANVFNRDTWHGFNEITQ